MAGAGAIEALGKTAARFEVAGLTIQQPLDEPVGLGG
jgi:hypothetical protein